MSHAYAYALECRSRNRSTSSVITTISTIAETAALPPTPPADVNRSNQANTDIRPGNDTEGGIIIRSPSHPSASRRFRGIKGSFRKRRERYHQKQEQQRGVGRSLKRKKTSLKKNKGSVSRGPSSPHSWIGGARRKMSSVTLSTRAGTKDGTAAGGPVFRRHNFPDSPLEWPDPKVIRTQEELFASPSHAATLPYSPSPVSSTSSLSGLYTDYGEHESGGNRNYAAAKNSEKHEDDGGNEVQERWRLQPPPRVYCEANDNESPTSLDSAKTIMEDWRASGAAAMVGVDFGHVEWGRQWEQTAPSWSRGALHTTASPPALDVREDVEKADSVVSPATTNMTSTQQQHQQHKNPYQDPSHHDTWFRKISTVSSGPRSILIGLDDHSAMGVDMTAKRSYGLTERNFSHDYIAIEERDEEERSEESGIVDINIKFSADPNLPLLLPAVYQPEPGTLVGMGTFAPASVPVRLPSQRRMPTQPAQQQEQSQQPHNTKKRATTLLTTLAIRALRNKSTSSNSSAYSDGVHEDDNDNGDANSSRTQSAAESSGHDADHPDARQASVWEDEDVPELTPDSGRTSYTHRRPSSTSTTSTFTHHHSHAYPGWALWASLSSAPRSAASTPHASASPRSRLSQQQQQQQLMLQDKPLPLLPALACPGCRIGGGPGAESDGATPRDRHAGALRWPEEHESGFCNACQLGGGLLPDNFSRFTRAFDGGEMGRGEENRGPQPQQQPQFLPQEELARLMLLGGLGDEAGQGGEGADKKGREGGGKGEKTVRNMVAARPSLLNSKFRLGMISESKLASRRQLGDGNVIARCESAPPPPTTSGSAERRASSTSRVAECLPPGSEAVRIPVPPKQPLSRASRILGDGVGQGHRPQSQQANSSRPRRGGIGGGKRRRPPRLSTEVSQLSLSRSNARRWTDPADDNLADRVRGSLGDCWELDVLKEYEAESPVAAAPPTPSVPPLQIARAQKASRIDDWSTKTPVLVTPRTQMYNHFKRANGDF